MNAPNVSDRAAPGMPAPRIVGRPGLGGKLELVVRRIQNLSEVPFPEPCLVHVTRGQKRLTVGDENFTAGPGEVLFVNAGVRASMLNLPDEDGLYTATCVVLASDLVREHAGARGGPPGVPWRALAKPDLDGGVLAALVHVADGMSAQSPLSDRLLRHRLLELLIALDDAGCWCRVAAVAGMAERARRILGAEPAAPWTAATLAARLHLGESSLRRALGAEGHSFRGLLDEVRMGLALALLQGSSYSVQRIALECGYASASRFSARFRCAFGVLPSVLRGVSGARG